MDELFIIVRYRSPYAYMADVLFAVYSQNLLSIIGVVVWVAVLLYGEMVRSGESN